MSSERGLENSVFYENLVSLKNQQIINKKEPNAIVIHYRSLVLQGMKRVSEDSACGNVLFFIFFSPCCWRSVVVHSCNSIDNTVQTHTARFSFLTWKESHLTKVMRHIPFSFFHKMIIKSAAWYFLLTIYNIYQSNLLVFF